MEWNTPHSEVTAPRVLVRLSMKIEIFGITGRSVRGDRDSLPRECLLHQDGRKDTSGSLDGQPQHPSQGLPDGNGLEVQKVKPR